LASKLRNSDMLFLEFVNDFILSAEAM
jgi:hypothetical protein